MSFIQKISLATRLTDWRFSFVPFIIGCVYLWVWWFQIPFNLSGVLLLLFSLLTTAGFASLGYLINELFDIESDLKAGKRNRLAGLPAAYVALAFILSLLITFLPWLYLPANNTSWALIVAEILAFLLYSLPFPRLKKVPVCSNVLDAAYAYTLPLLLSFHTFHLASPSTSLVPSHFFFLFAVVVTLSGLRNIVIHQIDDVFRDKLSGIYTLPMVLGTSRTTGMLLALLVSEICLHFSWAVALSSFKPVFIVWIFLYAASLLFTVSKYTEKPARAFFSIHKARHLTDNTNQIFFPLFTLALLLSVNGWWAVILPFHILLLMPPLIMVPVTILIRDSATYTRYQVPHYFRLLVVYPVSLLVNYSIYFTFRLLGINLKKQNKSALDVLKSCFKNL